MESDSARNAHTGAASTRSWPWLATAFNQGKACQWEAVATASVATICSRGASFTKTEACRRPWWRGSCTGVEPERCAQADPRVAANAGQENNRSRSPQRRSGDGSVANMDCALTLLARGRPVKLVRECLGVSCSQSTVGIKQSASPTLRRC